MTILRCRYGNFSVPDRNDLILNALREYGEWAQEELDMLGRFVRPGDTVLDVGAFIGTHARAFSQMVGARGEVHAFEPNEQSYCELIKNAELAPCANIKTYRIALGGRKQSRRLLQDDARANLGASRLTEDDRGAGVSPVEVEPLDNLDFARVDFIKADVEGMEHDLLVGGTDTIRQHRPIVFLEANLLDVAGRIVDWAHDMGYAVFGDISRAFNPDNFNRSAANMFGEARECGLLLIHRENLAAWRGTLSSLRLPLIETVDSLALLLLHKPQYVHEVLGCTAVAERHGVGFVTPALAERDGQIAGLGQALAERDGQIAGLGQALAERDGQIAAILSSTSWRLTRPLRFVKSLLSRSADAVNAQPALPKPFNAKMPEIFWSFDSLVVRDNALFGFGWIFHPTQKITALRFRLMFAEKEGLLPEYIFAEAGKPRDDVERAFANQQNALNSGYVIYGAFPAAARLDSIHLECSLADGSVIELAVPPSSVLHFSNENEADNNRLMLRQFGVFFKRGLHLIRAGKLTSLFEKARRYLRGRPKAALHKPSDLSSLLRQRERNNLCLILDHDLGGGANHYRDRLVDSILREDRTTIILTYQVATLSHMLIVRNSRINLRYSIPDRAFLLDAVRYFSVSDIIYNTAVSLVRPQEIPQLLISLKQLTSARLKVLAHDFYLVCPSHFLLDHKGEYCHIPDTSVCTNCLPRNRQGFATLFVERDMPKWRAIWGALLVSADEIVTFSNSTAQLLMKAYPQIAGSRISITPHSVEHLPGDLVRVTETSRLCIGIVGHIGYHKGAAFIQALAREIKQRELDLKIVVIGLIEASCEPSVLSQTGSYRHEELPGLIEKSGANVMLFPSICPETFSYVVHELMDMKLPVASFNFGAPAERLASYSKGLVLSSMDPASVLDELISFHRKTYLAH